MTYGCGAGLAPGSHGFRFFNLSSAEERLLVRCHGQTDAFAADSVMATSGGGGGGRSYFYPCRGDRDG